MHRLAGPVLLDTLLPGRLMVPVCHMTVGVRADLEAHVHLFGSLALIIASWSGIRGQTPPSVRTYTCLHYFNVSRK